MFAHDDKDNVVRVSDWLHQMEDFHFYKDYGAICLSVIGL